MAGVGQKGNAMSENIIYELQVGDIVILEHSGPNWRVVPAKPNNGLDVILHPGVTIIDRFYRDSQGKRIVCLEQDETGDIHEIEEGATITRAFVIKE